MELTERDVKLGVGIVAAAASRHYFKQRKLWPWRISTLVAWPALGLAVMDTVIGWAEPKEPVLRKVADSRSHDPDRAQAQAEQLRLARAELAGAMADKLRPDSNNSSGGSSSNPK